jgi:transcriptional regulator with XRE-family HTH domain
LHSYQHSDTNIGMSHLRAWRKKRGLTQEQLAEQSGIDQGTISALETAEDPNPTWKTLQRLSAVLRVKADELFPANERVSA